MTSSTLVHLYLSVWFRSYAVYDSVFKQDTWIAKEMIRILFLPVWSKRKTCNWTTPTSFVEIMPPHCRMLSLVCYLCVFWCSHKKEVCARLCSRVQLRWELVHFQFTSAWNVNFRLQIDFTKKPMSATSVHLVIQPTSMSSDAHYLRTHRGIGLDIGLSIYAKTVIDSVIKKAFSTIQNQEW